MQLEESLPLDVFLYNLKKLRGFTPEFDTIWPAHGSLDKLPLPKNILEDMINGIDAVLAGKMVGIPEHTFTGDGIRYDFGTCGVLCRYEVKNAV
jgi:hypothetical protein